MEYLNDIDYDSIDEQSYEDYINQRQFEDEYLEGTIDIQTDVDDFRTVAAECTIPGEVIQEWLNDNLINIVDKMTNTPTPEDLASESAYYDYCMKLYSLAEDIWYDTYYPDLCEEYFQENADPYYD